VTGTEAFLYALSLVVIGMVLGVMALSAMQTLGG